jgi:hypothetical protein
LLRDVADGVDRGNVSHFPPTRTEGGSYRGVPKIRDSRHGSTSLFVRSRIAMKALVERHLSSGISRGTSVFTVRQTASAFPVLDKVRRRSVGESVALRAGYSCLGARSPSIGSKTVMTAVRWARPQTSADDFGAPRQSAQVATSGHWRCRRSPCPPRITVSPTLLRRLGDALLLRRTL